MNDMDLVPGEFRRELTLRLQIRRFVWALALLLAAVVAARALLGYLTWREKSQVVSLEQRQLELSRTQSKAESVRQQSAVTQQQLAALETLQGRDLVEQFLRSVDDAFVEHIWLDGIRFQRRAAGAAPPGEGTGQTEESVADLDLLHDAELTGHASSHSDLAAFMQRLGAEHSVSDLRLISTATRSYTSVQVIDFKLALLIRGKERK